MCHSYEMYRPGLARDAAEHRLGAADFAAAERERALVDRLLALLRRLRRRSDTVTEGTDLSIVRAGAAMRHGPGG